MGGAGYMIITRHAPRCVEAYKLSVNRVVFEVQGKKRQANCLQKSVQYSAISIKQENCLILKLD